MVGCSGVGGRASRFPDATGKDGFLTCRFNCAVLGLVLEVDNLVRLSCSLPMSHSVVLVVYLSKEEIQRNL